MHACTRTRTHAHTTTSTTTTTTTTTRAHSSSCGFASPDHTHAHVHMHTCTHAHMHAYTHAHIHTHTNNNNFAHSCMPPPAALPHLIHLPHPPTTSLLVVTVTDPAVGCLWFLQSTSTHRPGGTGSPALHQRISLSRPLLKSPRRHMCGHWKYRLPPPGSVLRIWF